jgi:hypothetical protein
MTESNNKTKNRKRGKIVNSAFSAFLIPFVGGAILSFGTQIGESYRNWGIVAMAISSILFIWTIIGSAKDAIKTEERISKLEDQIKELEKRK